MKRSAADDMQALRDELAEMARTGSPETKLQRVREAEELQRARGIGFASLHRPPDKSLPPASPAERVAAERRFRIARNHSLLLLALLMCLSAVPVCLPANPVAIGASVSIAIAIILALLVNRREHRAAYVALQMANGISERDACRDYDNKYSGD